jgi:geranylgeranyl pyrophosphate synthase
MTLIAIHAMETGLELPNFRKVFGNGTCEDTELENAVNDLVKSGSIDYAMKRAMHHHSIAHGCLDKMQQNQAVNVLRELTDMQLSRIN